MNIQHSVKLADYQQKLFDMYIKGEPVSKKEIDTLKRNLWVWLASWIAPSNLTIRHYTLLALLTKSSKYNKVIKENISALLLHGRPIHPLKDPKLWREGYSYWLYLEPFLLRYIDVEKELNLDPYAFYIIRCVRQGFSLTSISNKDGTFPVPIGDTWLSDRINTGTMFDQCSVGSFDGHSGFVDRTDKRWLIIEHPVGFNLHTKEAHIFLEFRERYGEEGSGYEDLYQRVGIRYERFKYYEGYSRKYKNFFMELLDLISWKRIKSALVLVIDRI